jgi:aryl-alcohol dehydrogenase-like predicted oxidoreductase
MNYRQLGNSDLNVSCIGLGTMSWPFCDYGEIAKTGDFIDRAPVQDMVSTALDTGINLFDTAEGYGRGLAETLLGDSLHALGKRDQAVIVTKVGPLFADEKTGERECNLSAQHIKARCELSLRRLRTDHIDLYLAHRPDSQTPIEETIAAMTELQSSGKIRFFGVSNFNCQELSAALSHGKIVANQLVYNLIERGIDANLRPLCVKENVGIMGYSPLGKGVLSGKYDEAHLPPDDDYRHGMPHFAKDKLPRHFAIARRCRELARQIGIPTSQLVIAWCLAQPGITTSVPGAKRAEQVKDSAQAGAIKLPQAIVEELNSFSA